MSDKDEQAGVPPDAESSGAGTGATALAHRCDMTPFGQGGEGQRHRRRGR